jgi:transcriptional regulator with XRE-family HTH domain
MEIKNNLYELRKKNGMTQDEMAEKLMITRQAVSRWETGETVPNIDTLIIISQTFEVSIDYLLGQIICQSCASSLTEPKDFGTEADGSKNIDYCAACYENGSLYGGDGMTMEEMIDICVPYAVKAGKYKDDVAARVAMLAMFPKMKRWAQHTN